MRNQSDRSQPISSRPAPAQQTVSTFSSPKRLGTYLVDAGLLTADQINVILNDQQATGMRFGDIIVARGWLKEQTIEWVVAKVVEPERQLKQHDDTAARRYSPSVRQFGTFSGEPAPTVPPGDTDSFPKPIRRELPISKPLPSVRPTDGDVSWVG